MIFLGRFIGRIHQVDLFRERDRYNLKATKEIIFSKVPLNAIQVLNDIDYCHRRPYIEYYGALRELITSNSNVLELGCGTGFHSSILVELGANVTLLDISEVSLEVCKIKFGSRIDYICADMSATGLPENFFDIIVANGALSYADHNQLVSEINRILKPNGSVIFLDSLNHNLFFITNRLIHFFLRRRSISTLLRIPRTSSILKISKNFENFQLTSYGTYIWLFPILKVISGEQRAVDLLQRLDRKKKFSKYGFKFLLICRNLSKQQNI